jgi:protein involved in polysaccharide export with SLBB domain
LDLNKASIVKKNVNTLDQKLQNALSVNVFNYVNEPSANILVKGAIEEPGFYDASKYRKLSDLINDLKFIDVYPWLGVLEQFDENELIKSTVLFNLNDSSTYSSVEILPNSRIYFANIYARSFEVAETSRKLINEYELRLSHRLGNFRLPVYGKYSVSSFINLLGLDMSDVDEVATYVSPLKNIVINDNYKNMQYTAEKYNTVNFRSPDNDLIEVSIRGAVDFPGTYVLNDDATIQNLYQLVGDFKDQAYVEGIILTRQAIRNRQLKSIQKSREDLNKAILTSVQTGENIGDINIIRALSENIEPANLGRLAGDFSSNSQGSINTILFDGDTIIVPKNPNAINVLGEVLNPIAFQYSKKFTIRSAINQAGGYQQYADKRRVYVIKANGIVEKANRNIFVRNIDLEPGDTIVVPRKIITNNPVIEALIPITQVLSDLAFSAAALDNLSNN